MSFIVDPFCLGEQYRDDRKKHAIIWKTIEVDMEEGWYCVKAELPKSMRIGAPQALIKRMDPRNPISYVWGIEQVFFLAGHSFQPNGSMIYARSWNYEAYYPDTWVPSSP